MCSIDEMGSIDESMTCDFCQELFPQRDITRFWGDATAYVLKYWGYYTPRYDEYDYPSLLNPSPATAQAIKDEGWAILAILWEENRMQRTLVDNNVAVMGWFYSDDELNVTRANVEGNEEFTIAVTNKGNAVTCPGSFQVTISELSPNAVQVCAYAEGGEKIVLATPIAGVASFTVQGLPFKGIVLAKNDNEEEETPKHPVPVLETLYNTLKTNLENYFSNFRSWLEDQNIDPAVTTTVMTLLTILLYAVHILVVHA